MRSVLIEIGLAVFVVVIPSPVVAQNQQQLAVITLENVGLLVEIEVLGDEERFVQNNHLAFGPNGDFLVYDTTFQTAETRLEGAVHVWRLDPFVEIASMPGSLQGFMDASRFSYCVANQKQYVFDLVTGGIMPEEATEWCGILSPTGELVATGENYYFWLGIRERQTGKRLVMAEVPAVWRAFNADGSLLATSSMMNEIAIWDVAYLLDLKDVTVDVAQAIMPHQGVAVGPGGGVGFSPDGNYLVYSSGDGLFVWDVQEEELVTQLGDNVYANGIAFSPNGELMVHGLRGDDIVRIWDTASWEQIGELPFTYITDVEFSPDGTMLALGSEGGTVRLWGVPVTNQ